MQQSGLDDLLREPVRDGAMIYGRWSAGAVVAGSSLRGLELMDDAEIVVEGHRGPPVWDGLGLVDFTIVPHFQSPRPQAEAAARALAWLAKRGLPYCALRDGEALIL